MKVIDENRKTVQMMKKYSTDEDVTAMTTYYTYAKQIVNAFPVSEQQVGVPIASDVARWYLCEVVRRERKELRVHVQLQLRSCVCDVQLGGSALPGCFQP